MLRKLNPLLLSVETEAQTKALEARDIHCSIGEGAARVEAVRGLSFELEAGELVSVVGPSGCGKSSLLYALGLLDQVESGEVVIAGKTTGDLSEEARTEIRNRHIGFVFQFHYLLGELTALENVRLPMMKYGVIPQKDQLERAAHLLDQVGLSDKRNRPGNQLSGGERQRVALARALANAPKVVLADEPTGNLDQANSDKVFELLKTVAQSERSGILLVTHNAEMAARADRTLTMRDGVFV